MTERKTVSLKVRPGTLLDAARSNCEQCEEYKATIDQLHQEVQAVRESEDIAHDEMCKEADRCAALMDRVKELEGVLDVFIREVPIVSPNTSLDLCVDAAKQILDKRALEGKADD